MKTGLLRLLYLCLVLLWVSACATRRTQTTAQSGQPGFRSIYYYVLGSYYQTGGDYVKADLLLRRAAEEDPRSQGIKRQILLNDFELWRAGELSAASLRLEIEDYLDKYGRDEELLYAACDFFEAEGDIDSALKALEELQASYPSSRADLRRFVHELQTTGQGSLELLDAARIKADSDPATLRLLAGIWFYYDPAKEKEALLRSQELAPDAESHAYLADYIVRNQDLELARQYFAQLSYPEDRDLMFLLTDSDWLPERDKVLIELAEPLLATGDLDLLNPLAYAALLEGRPDLLARIAASLDTLADPQGDKQNLCAILAANSILHGDDQSLQKWLEQLAESGYYDALLRYYLSGVISQPLESWEIQDPTAYQEFIAQARNRLPDGPVPRYLISLATAVQDSSYTALPDARYALITDLRQRHTLCEEDYSFLLGYHNLKERQDLHLQALREAVEAYPDNPGFCNDLGYSMLTLGEDPEAAARLIRHALVFEPQNIFYLDSLAWYHYLKGETEEALKLLALPMAQSDLPAEIAWHIGAVHLALGDHPSARQWLQRCLEIGDDPVATAEAEKALKLLPQSD